MFKHVLLGFGTMCAALTFLFVPQFAHAAALTSTNVEPATLVAGATGTATVTFTTATSIPADGKIVVTFANTYEITATPTVVCSPSIDGTLSILQVGLIVTITRQNDGTIQTSGVETCTITNVKNRSAVGSTSTSTIETQDGTGTQLDVDAAVAADTIIAATLTSTSVQPVSGRPSVTGVVNVAFTMPTELEGSGKIKVTFPSGYVVSGVSSATCSTMTGTFTVSYSGQVVTIVRVPGLAEAAGIEACSISGITNPSTVGTTGTYTITTTDATDGVHATDAAVTGSDIANRSSSSTVFVPLTYTVTVMTPVSTDSYTSGDSVAVTWTSAGTGSFGFVNLSYSTDAGATWTSIATNEMNDGAYTWTVPTMTASAEVMLKVEGTDMVTVVATDMSDAFTVTAVDEAVAEDPATDDELGTGEIGHSYPAGTYIKGTSWSTVYYTDADGTRRPFLDSQTYFTYMPDFSNVVTVADEDLSEYMIGTPMLPKAGSVLIKVQSVNKVYALGENGMLRWITSESLAISIYGSAWADYVIDVPATAWSKFTVGEDIDAATDIEVDMNDMQTRAELNA